MSGKIQHGGALDRAIERYGGRRDEWLDLSTGINPEGVSVPALDEGIWRRLPEQDLLDRVLERAREFYRVPDNGAIIAAPGTQSLIQILPHALGAVGRVDVVSPTYGEYALSFGRSGWQVEAASDAQSISAEAKAAVIVNPNNPDGCVTALDEISALAETLASRGGSLIVDEAFQDAGDSESAAGLIPQGGLVVTKSFGKFFGLAGLRLGFAIAQPDVAAALGERLGPWAVSAPALAVADRVLGDLDAIAALRERMSESAELLRQALADAGLVSVGATGLFRLVRHEKAGALHEALCRRHVLVRAFDYRPDWLRFGLAPRGSYAQFQMALCQSIAEIAD
jgi:cobalamin biosynthetic protein CobC